MGSQELVLHERLQKDLVSMRQALLWERQISLGWLLAAAGLKFPVPDGNLEMGFFPQLIGGDWNMTFICPYIGNNHPN